jgi:hypothetical protein
VNIKEERTRPASDGSRLITYADPDTGLLTDFSIEEFVVLKTVHYLDTLDPDAEFDQDEVSTNSGRVAALLRYEGWFTKDEYVGALVRDEMEDLEEELEDDFPTDDS